MEKFYVVVPGVELAVLWRRALPLNMASVANRLNKILPPEKVI